MWKNDELKMMNGDLGLGIFVVVLFSNFNLFI